MTLATWCLLALAFAPVSESRADAPGIAALERNKAVARSLFEDVLSKGDWEMYRRIHAPSFRAHTTGESATLEEDLASAKEWRAAFPDVTVRVERVVAEDELVAVHWIASGTNSGTGQGLPATGKSIKAGGMTIFRMKGGLIAEEWSSMDSLQMLRQLGLLPSR